MSEAITRRAFAAMAAAGMTAPALAQTKTKKSPAAPPPGFRAGAAASNITPRLGTPLDGVIAKTGPARGIHDELHARSLAVADGRATFVFTVCDLRMIGRRLIDEAKRMASEATGVPVTHMLVSATHTHAVPTPIDLDAGELYEEYQRFVTHRIADAIRRAVGNLAPAKIGFGSVDKPEYAFNRRWLARPGSIPPNPFGETTDKAWMNPSRASGGLIEPAGPVDPQMSVVSVQHADGRPMAMLANYSTHYVGGYAGAMASADYYGYFSEAVKRLLAPVGDPPFVAMMSNGTSGDVNTLDFSRPGGPSRGTPWTAMQQVGQDMAQAAVNVARAIEHRADVTIAAAQRELELGVRKPDAARLAWAEALLKDPTKSAGRSGIYAREALVLARFPERVKLIVQAVRLGNIGIAAAPCEVFAETGLEIKQRSPIQPAFTIELANGYNGYLPTPRQHALGGYETWPARSSYLEVQASEKIRDAVLDLLQQVKG